MTEFRQKKPHHTAPISIEVEYQSRLEIEDVVAEYLWNYRRLYLPVMKSDEVSQHEYEECQLESLEAWSALAAAFGHHERFEEQWLQDMTDGAYERVKARLIEWSHQIEWPGSIEEGMWKGTANTAKECFDKTQTFMSDKYWPFTKVIRYVVRGHIAVQHLN